MSPSAYITKRTTPTGKTRWVVRYRLGGRYTPLVHAGSFPSLREARLRRDFVAGELAAGRNPADTLRAAADAPAPTTYADQAERYRRSRIDYADETTKNLGSHFKRLLPHFGRLDPAAITVADCQDWIAKNLDLKPSSLRRYYGTHRLILDYAGIDPNPARDPRVKLPTIVFEEPSPPPAAHVIAILERVPPRWRLPLVVIEQTAMAVGEAAQLEWGDVDESGGRLRLRRQTVKAQIRTRARNVQVPEWLMALIAATCPVEDRTPSRRVFPGFTPDAAKSAIARACKTAGIPHYHPHDLRHRRLSLWHGQGVPARELAERAGHARASTTLDVYSHVMPLDEVPETSLRAVMVRRP